MITQQEIVDEVNRLALHYNVTWKDIKIDADKAVVKINNFLGANYPMMTVVLTSPESTYSFNSGIEVVAEDYVHYQLSYFPDEYIYSIVLPFIAMEVLARDEEFTTVYTKYEMEVQEGIFQMFQKEFNRVPLAFRQNPGAGVFFGADSAKSVLAHNGDADLPVYKFKVYYHEDNANLNLSGVNFSLDTRSYLYEDTAFVKNFTQPVISVDGTTIYEFDRWAKDRNQVSDGTCEVGYEITMISDVHYYAVWNEISTLVNENGVIRIKDEYKYSITKLVIPDVLDNNLVKVIPTDFLKVPLPNTPGYLDATRIESIELPKYLTTIQTDAFTGFNGDVILFNDNPLGTGYEGITIETGAFADCGELLKILLPANIIAIAAGAVPSYPSIHRKIYCRILLQNKPDAWIDAWYTESDPEGTDQRYTAYVEWGHNDG